MTRLVGALVACVFAAFAVPAMADSLPSKIGSPIGEVGAKGWTGFYGAIGLGYSTTDVLGFEIGDNTICTAQIGYDHQFAGTRLVGGVIADYTIDCGGGGITSLDGSWFVGARLGVLVSDSLLGYGQVGYTATELGAFGGGGATFEGFTLGAGAELMFTKSLALKLDWRRVDLGSLPGGGPLEVSADELRLLAVYRF